VWGRMVRVSLQVPLIPKAVMIKKEWWQLYLAKKERKAKKGENIYMIKKETKNNMIYIFLKKRGRERSGLAPHGQHKHLCAAWSTQHCFHKQEGLSSKPLLLPPRPVVHTH
jgi:hypothetical protein